MLTALHANRTCGAGFPANLQFDPSRGVSAVPRCRSPRHLYGSPQQQSSWGDQFQSGKTEDDEHHLLHYAERSDHGCRAVEQRGRREETQTTGGGTTDMAEDAVCVAMVSKRVLMQLQTFERQLSHELLYELITAHVCVCVMLFFPLSMTFSAEGTFADLLVPGVTVRNRPPPHSGTHRIATRWPCGETAAPPPDKRFLLDDPMVPQSSFI